MKFWLSATGIFFILLFSGCGLLLRNRKGNHHGIEKHDFGLPVITYPSGNPFSQRILFLFSGDGGWIDFEDQLALAYAKRGFFVVGFNSRSYFWEQRTPEQTAVDVQLLVKKYTGLYKGNRIYMCGYSFGADVLPFIYNRLPLATKNKVIALQMLSPFATSDFMVHTSELLNLADDNHPYKVRQEVEKITIPIYCFYGEAENPKALALVKADNFSIGTVPGGHRYETSGYEQIVASLRPSRRFL
ncbi:hypothetical protein LPB86_13780 [Pedobacter sp. MC2016-14]|uniref:AcvB/VirJ family lysyl-phosphatidylglycerol hydrolase n=1 Tax=Pedobacter sp. MC2016-14 TaxID=2897327 RepID=UPI001E406404|nr:AcvB/VirJ family lysyl-phosphatidylglycerol hydrolase [Pedobacter sp. MC2016-14]MCD0489306.1 hypothetical protein [Pedobacter sp. MC2016-14]